MPKKSDDGLKRIAINASIVLLVGLCVYFVSGIAFNATSVALYSPAPTTFENTRDAYNFQLDVHNNSPYSPPYVKPFYSVSVSIVGNSTAFAYFSSTGGTFRNFTESGVDIGLIESGSSEALPIFVNVGDGQNFNLTVNIWYHFVVAIKSESITYSFENQGDNYRITQLP